LPAIDWRNIHIIETSNEGELIATNSTTIFTDEDSKTNDVSLSMPPTDWETTWAFNVYLYNDFYDGNRKYEEIGTQTYTSEVEWTLASNVGWQEIQLPARNARVENSKIGLGNYKTYSAGTAGSPGS
jgi:hypothetical protein